MKTTKLTLQDKRHLLHTMAEISLNDGDNREGLRLMLLISKVDGFLGSKLGKKFKANLELEVSQELSAIDF